MGLCMCGVGTSTHTHLYTFTHICVCMAHCSSCHQSIIDSHYMNSGPSDMLQLEFPVLVPASALYVTSCRVMEYMTSACNNSLVISMFQVCIYQYDGYHLLHLMVGRWAYLDIQFYTPYSMT